MFNNETGIIIDNKKLFSGCRIANDNEADADEKVILDIVGKMLPPFEELENLFISKPENERTNDLSELLVTALKTSNPVMSLNNILDFHRSMRSKIKFIEYLSKSTNAFPIIGESLLTDLVKNNRWYKNKVSFDNGKIF